MARVYFTATQPNNKYGHPHNFVQEAESELTRAMRPPNCILEVSVEYLHVAVSHLSSIRRLSVLIYVGLQGHAEAATSICVAHAPLGHI